MKRTARDQMTPESKNKTELLYKTGLIIAFVLFGTIGVFRRNIIYPSGTVAFFRGAVGAAVLFAVMLISGKKPALKQVRANLPLLLLSGAMIGFNWILLFEAYNHTTVATATLCYYMAPLLIIIASPFFFSEKKTLMKTVCVLLSLTGMVLISGITKSGFSGASEYRGILLGLGAAVLYAGIIIINKRISGIPAYDKTIVQLGAAAAVMLPYSVIAGEIKELRFETASVLLLLLVGILHTGLAYAVYFGAVEKLNAQTCAIFSYIDPVTAVLLSIFLLREPFDLSDILGAVLIIGSAVLSELTQKKKRGAS